MHSFPTATPSDADHSAAQRHLSVAHARPTGTGPRTCRCMHGRSAHRHYRRGSDCALCPCPRYRWALWQRLSRALLTPGSRP